MAKDIKNVFISHYSQDEQYIGNVKALLAQKGYVLRNSSVDSTKRNSAENEDYIKNQILRPGINWAGTTVVLVGPETHTRWWVDWEIEQSNRAENRIVGVHLEGAADSVVPDALAKYGDALVGWQADRIIDAIEGRINNMENSDGSSWENPFSTIRSNC